MKVEVLDLEAGSLALTAENSRELSILDSLKERQFCAGSLETAIGSRDDDFVIIRLQQRQDARAG